MTIAKQILKDSSKNTSMLTDFELAYQLAVDAHTSDFDKVKFYFSDSSTIEFFRKDQLWYVKN